MKLNLGCADKRVESYLGVDIFPGPAVDIVADLSKTWPWEDSTVDSIIAHDFIEHLPNKIFTMNEIHRVLKPGGVVDILVPSSNGMGADQDPTHVSYWNKNSFQYYQYDAFAHQRFAKSYGITASFKVVRLEESIPWDVPMVTAVLSAVKT